MKRILSAVCMFLIFTGARANLPESGWYWNPQASGSGFNIELQDDKLFLSAFTYDTQGRNVFYTAGGVFNVNASTLTSTMYATSSGQCFGCPYSAPVTTALAPVEVYFPTTRTARVRVFLSPGTAEINLVRFNFGYPNGPTHEHLGVWSILEEGVGVYFGESLNMRSACAQSGLIDSFCGERFGSSQRVAVGARAAAGSSLFIVLLDSSTSYYSRYIYVNDTNRWFGISATYLKTSATPPADYGLSFIGSRLSGPSTANQIGLSQPEVLEDPKLLSDDAYMADRAMRSKAGNRQVEAEVEKALRALPPGTIERLSDDLAKSLQQSKLND